MSKQPGPAWVEQLAAAGENGDGFGISIADGSIHFEPTVPQARRDAIAALWDAHDPTRESQAQRDDRIERAILRTLADEIEADPLIAPRLREAVTRLIRRPVR